MERCPRITRRAPHTHARARVADSYCAVLLACMHIPVHTQYLYLAHALRRHCVPVSYRARASLQASHRTFPNRQTVRTAQCANCTSSAVHIVPCRSSAHDRGCVYRSTLDAPLAVRGHSDMRCPGPRSFRVRAAHNYGVQRQDVRMPCWEPSESFPPGSDPGPANGLPGQTVRDARAKHTHLAVGGFSVLGYTSGVRG